MTAWKPGDIMRPTAQYLSMTYVGHGLWRWTHEDARPLVVIDPEDTEQVERLAGLLAQHGAHRGRVDAHREARGIERALREYATPTPPRCVAHGAIACEQCSRISADNLDGDECRHCGTWGDTGMHWDTCAGRIRGQIYANRDEATA